MGGAALGPTVKKSYLAAVMWKCVKSPVLVILLIPKQSLSAAPMIVRHFSCVSCSSRYWSTAHVRMPSLWLRFDVLPRALWNSPQVPSAPTLQAIQMPAAHPSAGTRDA